MRFCCLNYTSYLSHLSLRFLQAIAAFMATQLKGVVKRFSGGNDEDVSVWIRQVKLAARLGKIEDLAVVVPLYLDGPAFAVYEQLSSDDQEDFAKIESALLTAFSLNGFQAYEEFRVRKRREGESVDVFLSELRRLAKLGKIESCEEILRSAFVIGLPCTVSSQLRALSEVRKIPLDELVHVARALMAEVVRHERNNSSFSLVAVAAVAECSSKPHEIAAPEAAVHRNSNLRSASHSMVPATQVFLLWPAGTSCQHVQVVGKCQREAVCAGCFPVDEVRALPCVQVCVNGQFYRALVDTGCTQSMVDAKLAQRVSGKRGVVTVNGDMILGIGEASVRMEVDKVNMEVKCLVLDRLVQNTEFQGYSRNGCYKQNRRGCCK